jgi:hypothetical protein
LPDELEGLSNKRVLEEVKERSVGIFAIIAYGIASKKVYNSKKMDTSKEKSAWRPKSSLALI